MNETPTSSVEIKPVRVTHRSSGATFEGTIFVGSGRAVIEAIAAKFGRAPLVVVDDIVNGLLVKKGADWNGTILGEYLGLYAPSSGAFGLIADNASGRLVAHAVVFQSAHDRFAGLLAHVRTAGGWGGYGLGTRVTEEVTRSAFARGAKVVVLETDDRLLRKKEGERAAVGMYGKIGYAVLAEDEKPGGEKGWLMAIDRGIFELCQEAKRQHGGEFAEQFSTEVVRAQETLVASIRRRFAEEASEAEIEPVNAGDLASLFLLLSLCPPPDFRMKLSAWDVVRGADLERAFVVNVRPGIVDRDRLEDASLVLHHPEGGVLAICAARLLAPFSRQTYAIDFYCLPEFLAANAECVRALVVATIERIERDAARPRPCRLVHVGADEAKRRVFAELGFVRGANVHAFPGDGDPQLARVNEYEKNLG